MKGNVDCQELFEHLPISLWHEDFSQGKHLFDTLREMGVKDLRAYLNAHPEEIHRFARLTRVVDVNQATLKLYGARDKGDLLKSLDQFLATAEELEIFKEALIHLYDGHFVFEAETTTKTLLGTPLQILIRWTVSPGHEESLDFIMVSIIDITALKRAEKERELEARRFAILHEMENAILQNQPVEKIASTFLPQFARLLECTRGSILRFDYENGEARFLAFFGKGDYASRKTIPLSSFRNLDALKEGEPRIIEDLAREPFLTESDHDLFSHGYRAYITFPLIVEGRVIGVINFDKVQPGGFPPYYVELVREVASILSIAIHQASLEEKISQHTKELEKRVTEQTQQLTAKIREETRLNAALGNVLEDLQATNKILTRTTRKLEEANNELKIFTTSVSHDLRAPLRAIEGFGQALLEDYADGFDGTGREYLRRIVKAAQSMDTLITDLLTYSHLSTQEVTLQPVRLDDSVRRALKTFAAEIEKRGARVDVRVPLGWVLGHPTLLQQVIDNLLSNALKYSRGNVPPDIHIHVEEGKEFKRFFVRDNGIGISVENQARIFNLFERLHGVETYPGTGVGLTLVQKGVRKMKGKVGVISEEGKGSTFWIDFLRADPAEMEA